jgi:CheY-like chemotaxis protein
LIVEQNPMNQRLATAALSLQGYDVDICQDVRQAVDAATASLYLVILMDADAEAPGSFAAARAIRSTTGFAARTPIIGMIASDTPDQRHACFDAGMSSVVVKPVDWPHIDTVLRSGVQGVAATPADTVTTGSASWGMNADSSSSGSVAARAHSSRSNSWRLFDRLGTSLSVGDLATSLSVGEELHELVATVGGIRLASLASALSDAIRAGRVPDAIQAANYLWDELRPVFDDIERRGSVANLGVQVLPRQSGLRPRPEPPTDRDSTPAPWPAPSAAVVVG